MSTIEELRQLFVEQTGKDADNFNEDTVFTVDLVMNSFEIFGLICEVEEHFGIEIPDRVLMKLVTVGDLVNYIEENV